jgi:hypothetical protein
MRICKPVLASLAVIALVVALQAPAFAMEERFGPWVYYAPYYFPPDNMCMGCFLSPLDWLPRYESPNPCRPFYGGDCAHPSMPAPPRKIGRHAPRMASVGPPVAASPAPVRAQMSPSQFRPALRPIGQPRGMVSSGPIPVNHSGPQQGLAPAQRNIGPAR